MGWWLWVGPVLLAVVLLLGAMVLLVWWLIVPRPTRVALRGRHVVIIGGSSGIGLALAKLAAAEGARVSVVARDAAKLADARRSITEHCKQKTGVGGGEAQVRTYSSDVKVFASIEKVLEQATIEAGDVEVLVLSHGVALPGTFEETSLATIEHILDTNLRGSIYAIKAALPFIKSSRAIPASIAIFSSQAGQVGVYGYGAYAASKFALRGLAEVLQQELLTRNIRLSLVFPPDTDTPGFAEENKTKPELTKLLSGSSSSMDAMDVACKVLAGIKTGRFTISCNFDGFMLSMVTAGMSPQPSLAQALLELVTMGLFRVVALFVLKGWYSTILSSSKPYAKQQFLNSNNAEHDEVIRYTL